MPEIGEVRRGEELGQKNRKRSYIWHACVDCGKERWVRRLRSGEVRAERCQLCAAGLSNRSRSRDKSWNWEGGKIKGGDRNKYILVRLYPDNFFFPMVAKNNHYVFEHRLVMAKSLNRCLLAWEVVHHKNGIKNDNRIENLELLPSGLKHAPFSKFEQEMMKRDKKIAQLQSRVTLLEAELLIFQYKESIK